MPKAENMPGACGTMTLRDAELARDRDRVQRPGAAIGDEREIAGIEAALGGDALHRIGHRGGGDRAGCRPAAVVTSMPSGSAMRVRSARSAASTSSFISPPRKRSAPSRPSTRLASVTVGSVPPRP